MRFKISNKTKPMDLILNFKVEYFAFLKIPRRFLIKYWIQVADISDESEDSDVELKATESKKRARKSPTGFRDSSSSSSEDSLSGKSSVYWKIN